MNQPAPPQDDVTPRPAGRFQWEAVMRRAKLDKDLKFVAMMLASFADPDGTRIRPGELELAAATEMGQSTVRKHVAHLRDLGLVVQVSRGGGRGPAARASVFRLTIPLDLLDRVELRPPGKGPQRSMVLVSPLAQGSGDTEETPLAMQSGVDHSADVDNSETPLALVSGDTAPQPGNSAQSEPSQTETPLDSSETPLALHERPPSTPPSTTDHRLTSDPTQPTTPVDNSEPPPPNFSAIVLKPAKCPHGLRAHTRDGQPACPMCRRQVPAGSDPP